MKSKNTITKSTGYIISNPEHARVNDNVQLLRITITNVETKIDFGYQATDEYFKGGWIKISPHTFIRESGSKTNFILTNASNIPYGPEKLHFNSSIEWRYFSLYFPPISEGAKLIDLIETEPGDKTDFNFFRIKLNDNAKKIEIY